MGSMRQRPLFSDLAGVLLLSHFGSLSTHFCCFVCCFSVYTFLLSSLSFDLIFPLRRQQPHASVTHLSSCFCNVKQAIYGVDDSVYGFGVWNGGANLGVDDFVVGGLWEWNHCELKIFALALSTRKDTRGTRRARRGITAARSSRFPVPGGAFPSALLGRWMWRHAGGGGVELRGGGGGPGLWPYIQNTAIRCNSALRIIVRGYNGYWV